VPSPAAKAHLQFGIVIQENVGFDFEPAGYPSDVVDRDVPLRPLDAAEISAIDPALVRKSFLAQFTRSPKPTHVSRQNVPQRPFVSLLHRADFGPLTLLRRPLLSYIRPRYLQMRILLRWSLERFEKFADTAQRWTEQSVDNTFLPGLRSQAANTRQQAGNGHLPALRLRMVSSRGY